MSGSALARWGAAWLLCLSSQACAPSAPRDPAAQAVQLSGAHAADDDAVETSFGAFDPLAGLSLPWAEGDDVTYYQAVQGEPVRGDYLVQFFEPVGEPARATVAQVRAEVVGYFPHHTLLVAATDAQRDALAVDAQVRAVVPMPPLLRVDPALFDALPGSHFDPGDGPAHLHVRRQVDVAVEVDAPEHLALVVQALAHTGSEIVGHAGADRAESDAGMGAARRVAHVRLDATGLARLGRLAEVVAIEGWRAPRLLNERSVGLVESGAPFVRPLAALGLDGNGQRVAVADTGLDEGSCFFRERGKVVAYQNFAAPKGLRGDAHGHGTHVAGSIAGDSKKSRDGGVAPKARLVVQAVGLDETMGDFDVDMAVLLQGAREAGAGVQTNSWGQAGAGYTVMARELDRFVADHPWMVVVAAVGNEGDEGPLSVNSPATAKNVVAVGAYDGEFVDRVAWFSSQGPTLDGRIKPTLLAPGITIHSAKAGRRCKTETLSGTSMAAPMVAGAAALVRQYFQEGRHPGGDPNAARARVPSAALVKAVLVAGAAPIVSGRLGPPDTMEQGFGRVRLARALGVLPQGPRLWIHDGEVALDTAQRLRACFDVAPGADVDVALSWTDAPARQGAAVALVQDLDLSLWTADGNQLLGNADLQGANVPPTVDARNVEEVVRARNLPEGRTCVEVLARQTPLAPQRFALAILAEPRWPIEATLVAP